MANSLISTLAKGLGFNGLLSSVPSGNRGWGRIHEPFTGAWQRNITLDREGILANPYIFRCQSMIARDIANMPLKLVQKADGVWQEAPSTNPHHKVLHEPNDFQTHNQFFESYFLSKLMCGNTYVLKQRDGNKMVKKLYVLDPEKVQVLVGDSGQVYYQLDADNVAGIENSVTVPASEIIHDRWNCLFHPLVGISPLWANALNATQSQKISENAASFFANQSRPGGILVAPGKIADDTARRLKEAFDSNYSGDNAGRIAVVGDGLSFTPLAMKATDAQLVEQLKWTAITVVTTYGIPLYKVGLADIPVGGSIQSANVEYYSQALRGLIEEAEACLDRGLGHDGVTQGVEFDVDVLLRMDSKTQMEVIDIGKSFMELNERRAARNLPPKKYGNTIFMQQQDHSAEAIQARDDRLIAGESDLEANGGNTPTKPAVDNDQTPPQDDEEVKALKRVNVLWRIKKELGI